MSRRRPGVAAGAVGLRYATGMRIVSAAVALLVVGFALLGGRAARAEDPSVLEDPDYRFRIQRPGPAWRLLPEADARRVVPDAVAGLTDLRGSNFVVIVEEAPGVDLDPFVGVLQGNLALEDAEFSEVEVLTYQGVPARRWTGSGLRNGLAVRTRHLLLQRGRFLVQLVGFGVRTAGGGRPDSDLSVLEQHLVLTEGEIRPRRLAKVVSDMRGVGWRIRGGVYQDAAHGIELRPPEGWRLAVGSELATMNTSACVGLVAAAPEVYLVLIVERAHKVDRGPFLERLSSAVGESGGKAQGEPVAQVVGGRAFPLQRYRLTSGLPVTLYHGSRLDDGRAVQVQSWYISALEPRAAPMLESAYAAVRFLDEPARRALAAELLREPDPQDIVGPGYGLRRGLYRDFERRFEWAKPAGFWRVAAGQDARTVNAVAALSLEEPSLGLNGLVIAEELADAEPESLHRHLVERLEPKDGVPEPTRVDLQGAQALVSEVRPGVLPLPFRYTVASVIKGERAYQFLVWGLEGNLEAARPQVLEALHGLRFPERIVAQERQEDAFVDHRLGFRFRRPGGSGWRFTNLTPPAITSVATLASYEGSGGVVIAGAFCALQEGQDERFMRDLVLQMLRQRAQEQLGEPEETASTFLGLPGRRIVVQAGTRRMTAWLAQRERTFYLLLAGSTREAGLTEEQATGLLELLD